MSNKRRDRPKNQLLTFILYFLGLMLVIEWIYPLNTFVEFNEQLPNASEFEHTYLFIIFAIFCFLITYIPIPTWLTFIFKLLGIAFIIDYAYLPNPAFSQFWYFMLQTQWHHNVTALLQRDWYLFTDSFRMLLFLLIIALVSYLLYFWLVSMKRVFVFIVLTLIFVTVIDTFTPYQANQAIIRIVIASILMIVINTYLKKLEENQLPVDLKMWFNRVLAPLIIVMTGISFLSYFAPKLNPIWPDPVPFLRSAAEGFGLGSSGANRRVGYGEDDSRLGGSFQMDDTPVFHAETAVDHYWRIESKDYYSGHGWFRQPALNFQPFSEGDFQMTNLPSQSDEMYEATVQYTERFSINKMVYPYGIYDADHDEIDYFLLDQESGQFEPEITYGSAFVSMPELLQSAPFELSYEYPIVLIDDLRNASGAIPHEIAKTYLQLPNELPERIVQMAHEIVADQPTLYDQVAAVESYFEEADFSYQLNNIPIPDEGQDFVDQFLFDTKAGYCDHFSTSMVVMLRAVGIPARWVKGFTSGEQVANLSTDDEEMYRFEVTNSNAHSWVEVYFPGYGWIPFEPTIGFSGNEVVVEAIDEPIEEPDQPIEEPDDIDQEPDNDDEDEIPSNADRDEDVQEESTFSILDLWPWLLGLIVILLVWAAIKWRVILQQLLVWRWSRFKTTEDFHRAYQQLLVLLDRQHLKLQNKQTLEDYAQEVDERYANDYMSSITEEYVKFLYRKDYKIKNKEQLNEKYRALIKRILA